MDVISVHLILYCTFGVLDGFLSLQLRVGFRFGTVGFGRTCTSPVWMIFEVESNEDLKYVLSRNLLNTKRTP